MPEINEIHEDGSAAGSRRAGGDERGGHRRGVPRLEVAVARDHLDPRLRGWNRDVGAAIGIGGWHSPEGVARGEVTVAAEARGAGSGRRSSRRSPRGRGLGYFDLMGPVKETDDSRSPGRRDAGSSRSAATRCSRSTSPRRQPRSSTGRDRDRLVGRAPGVEAGMYAVAREAYPDVPGEEDGDRLLRGVARDGHAGRRRPARRRRSSRCRTARSSRTRSSRSPARDRRSRCTT